ncbi:unnamed protein product [Phaedon cochleariae]|uniref:Lipocalin/cytosolic fatty-acid binding domain-containing protein n=1 Tax=Phaedon cochleariae TaxID=80249 RepID=A0A9P0GQ05_PHACE|nr:unnamed protein product [Phaedon cochleariae]
MLCLNEHCRSIITTVIIICYLCLNASSGSGIGPCPKLQGMDKLNLTKFAGHWYEIERSFYLMELISSCVTVDIEERIKGKLEIEVKTRSSWTGTFSISEGIAVPTRKDPSILLYKVSSRLPRVINRYLPGAGFYQVLKTDYTEFAVIYSCTNYEVVHSDMIWIWGRNTEINVALRSEIYLMLTENHLDSERLLLSKHYNCTFNNLSIDEFLDSNL